MTPWLSVVGIGEDGISGLVPAARTLVETAEVLIGGDRHLAMVPAEAAGASAAERHVWPSPMSSLVARIPALRGRRVCVLATGDPLHFGVASALARLVDPAEMTILPGRSAFQLAAARLAWPLEHCALVTVHGRPLEGLVPHITPGAHLLILTQNATTPGKVAGLLTERGFGASRMVALAHIGGPRECRMEGTASNWAAVVPDLHTLAVECISDAGAIWYPLTGLPDEAFEHDGKLSKREVRALALAKLIPQAGAVMWDIGAGCGSIGIEWLRAAPHSRVVALEPAPERRALAARNAASLGAPGLDLRDGRAPEGLAGLPAPDAVFIGGGISQASIETSMQALRPGGRLVVHAVTLESEAVLLAAYARHAGELVRLSVSRAEPVGPFSGWRAAMPVTQWAWRKP